MSKNFQHNKAKWLAIIIFSVSIIVVASQSYEYVLNLFSDQGNLSTNRVSVQEFLTHDLIAISALKNIDTQEGIYTVEGYVVYISTCPTCNEGDQCKPCSPDNIIISEKDDLITDYALGKTEVITMVENSQEFIIGKKYRFIVNLKNSQDFIENQRDVEVIGFIPEN